MKICYLGNIKKLHLQKLVRYMHPQGHELHVISFAAPEEIDNGILNRIVYHPLGVGLSSSRKEKARNPFIYWLSRLVPLDIKLYISYEELARRTRQILDQIKPDIVHALFLTSYGYLAARAGYRPFMVTALGSDILSFPKKSIFKKNMLRYVLNRADRINSNSNNIRKEYLKYGVKNDRIFDVNFGIDLELYLCAGRQYGGGKLRIISTRNFHEVYNLKLLIEALRRLRGGGLDFECALVGSGPLENRLKDMVKRYNLQDRVSFLGQVDNQRLPDILRSADVFVSTSLSDGTNISLLEAMACGVFPVVTRIEGNEQWIKDGENGYLVPVDRPEYLASKLTVVKQDPQLRKNAAIENRKIVESNADIRKNMKMYEEEYKNLVSREKLLTAKSDEYLYGLYKGIDCGDSDFRNANLYKFVSDAVVGDSLLDVGAGAGGFMRYCANKITHVQGIEPNKKLRSLALQKGTHIAYSNLKEVNDLHNKYSTITVIDVLEHIEDDEGFVKSLLNLMEDGARLIAVVPAYSDLYGKRDIKVGHYRRYNKKYFVKMIKSTGLRLKEARYWNMLGVLPYWFSEKIIKREIANIRENKYRKDKGIDILNKLLFAYFRHVENRVNLGFGLSLFLVAEK